MKNTTATDNVSYTMCGNEQLEPTAVAKFARGETMKRLLSEILFGVLLLGIIGAVIIYQGIAKEINSVQAPAATPTKVIPLTPLPTVLPRPLVPPPHSANVTNVPSSPPPQTPMIAVAISPTPTPVPTSEALPSGLKVVYREYIAGQSSLWVASVTDPELRRTLVTLEDPSQFGLHISLSHDETKVAYTILPSGYGHNRLIAELRVVDLTNAQQRTLANQIDIGGFVNYPLWSPDDRLVAFRRQTASDAPFTQMIAMVNIETEEEIILVSADTSTWLWPIGWSPDGRYLYYTEGSERTELWRVNVAQNSTEYVNTIGKNAPNRCYFISPDGQWLLCTVLAGRDPKQYAVTLISAEAEQSQTLIIGASDELYNPIWYPDGQAVTINLPPQTDNRAKLQTINIQTGYTEAITSTEDGIFIPLAWSPDGQWIAVDKFPGRNQALVLISKDGTQVHKISASGGLQIVGWLRDKLPGQ
jgi:Tol biopolymer transport system component